jgi:hypothetical protein
MRLTFAFGAAALRASDYATQLFFAATAQWMGSDAASCLAMCVFARVVIFSFVTPETGRRAVIGLTPLQAARGVPAATEKWR